MQHLRQKIDKILLAISLFGISGTILAYNLYTVGGGTLTVSLQDLTAYANREQASAVSESAAANLQARESVFTSATPSVPLRDYELLEPIVKP